PSLSPLARKLPRRLPRLAGAASGHHRPRDRWHSNRHCVLSFTDRSPPADDLCWPKTAKERRELTETSRPPISLLRPPFSSTQAPGTRQAAGETFRRSSKLGPGAVAFTRHPPPGHRDFRAFWFKSVGGNFGIEQITGETLPKFR
ncbi:2-oxoglutarate and Fe(II)-dependent oxygenase superfamily protein, partial [Prunus dulcis]